MPSLLAFLRHVLPTIFGSTNDPEGDKAGSYNIARSPFPSNAIQKSVTHTVSYMPRAGDSDVVELMDVEMARQGRCSQW